MDLAFAELDQPLDEPAQPKRFDVRRGAHSADRLRHVLHIKPPRLQRAGAFLFSTRRLPLWRQYRRGHHQ